MAYQPKSYRKFVATAATATLVASAVTPAFAAEFTDVNSNYTTAVNYLVENNIAKGTGDTTFGTNNSITRGDAAVMIANVLKLDTANAPDSSFTDLNNRVEGAVNALYAKGIINGKSATEFQPAANITRAEMAKVIALAYGINGQGVDNEFTDVNSTFDEYVDALVKHEITLGITEELFGATQDVTRGQFALFMYRAKDIPGTGPVEEVDLEIASVNALNDTNSVLEVKFTSAVSELAPSDITIRNAETAARYGVQSVALSADGKTATVHLYEGAEDEEVLDYLTDYNITVQVDGEVLTATFNRPAFTESRIVDINVDDKEFVAADDKTGVERTIEVFGDVAFDYEAALGQLVRVWYNDENELVRYEIVSSSSAKYDAIEITEVDEIKLLTENKEYDISETTYGTAQNAESKFKFYVNGEEEDIADYVGDKFNFAKVGYDKSGDIEYVSAYNLSNFLVVDSVEGDEVIGYEGEGTGGSFDAEDATIVKGGKVIALSDLKQGDVLFFNNNADEEDGYARVVNNTVTGDIEAVYSNSIKVDGKTYDFTYSDDAADFGVEYGNAVYINEDGETEQIDSDIAEELQAGGEVTLYLDAAGNLVYVAGNTADVESNTKTALITDAIEADSNFEADIVQVEVVTEDGEEDLFDVTLEDLDTISVNGEEYDIENDGPDADEWTVDVADGAIVLSQDGATDVTIPLAAEGTFVNIVTNDDGDITDLEFFNDDAEADQDGYVAGYDSTIEAGDDYVDGKKLLDNTVVFDATDGYDPEDVTVTTWGKYNGSDIDGANFIYNEDDEVVALVITSTTTSDEEYEGAVVTDVLRNTDGEIVEITAYVNGTEQTFEVDEVENDAIENGSVVVFMFEEGNDELVQEITVDEDESYVVEDKIVDSVDVGKREVTFVDGSKYTLVSGGKVLDATDEDDITEEALSDLRGENIKVTIVRDEEDANFAQFFVFEDITATEYNELEQTQDFDNRAPVAVSAATLNRTVDENAANITFTPAQLATDADGDTLSIVAGSVASTNPTAATASVVDGSLVVNVANSVVTDAQTTVRATVTDGVETANVSFTVTVNNVPTAEETAAAEEAAAQAAADDAITALEATDWATANDAAVTQGQADVDAAQLLVDDVTNTTANTAFQERLDTEAAAISAREAALANEAAQTATDDAEAAQTAYTTAGGLDTDPVYVDVTDAIADLNTAVTSGTTQEIEAATTALETETAELETATTTLQG